MTAKKTISLTLALAIMAGMSIEARAGGDYYPGNGSVRDYGGTPVPAPIPVPVYDPVWYFRADAALGLGDAPDASESGILFGERANGYSAAHTFGTDNNGMASDYNEIGSLAFGVGYRWNDSFRMDVTGESRREVTYKLNDTVRGGPLRLGNSEIPGDILGSTNDLTTVRGAAFFVNAYYDLPAGWHGFTPYVGGGLGFAVSDVKRSNVTRERVRDRSGPSQTTTTQYTSSSSIGEREVSFAAAAMAGTTYRISDITELDFNYRYLFIDGTDTSLIVNGNTSKLTTDGLHDHQLRAGLRFNIQ